MGTGDDKAMLQTVTSANIACGFHAGDPSTMRRTCAWAAEAGVQIGVHVSYHDLAGFGRRRIDITSDDLAADVLFQLGALQAMAVAAGTQISYVKPHGALYWATFDNPGHAAAVIKAVQAWDRPLAVLGFPGSLLLQEAVAAGLSAIGEDFADRGYHPDGTLIRRSEPGAVLQDPARVAARVLSLATDSTILADGGSIVPIAAHSVCVHGDTSGATDIARAIHAALQRGCVSLAPFSTRTAAHPAQVCSATIPSPTTCQPQAR